MRRVRWLVGFVVGLIGLTAWSVDRAGVAVAPLDWSKPTAIVVLGARVEEDGAPSATLTARVAHAVEVARAGHPALFVVSGGVGEHGAAEAEVGLALARRLGIGDTPMAAEAASHTTHQNARLTAALLRERGITRAVLVSDPSHLLRAKIEFEREGLAVQRSPALHAPRHRSPLSRAFWTCREVAALARVALR